jgi:hypothetical protein
MSRMEEAGAVVLVLVLLILEGLRPWCLAMDRRSATDKGTFSKPATLFLSGTVHGRTGSPPCQLSAPVYTLCGSMARFDRGCLCARGTGQGLETTRNGVRGRGPTVHISDGNISLGREGWAFVPLM